MSKGANCVFERDDVWKIASVNIFYGFYYLIDKGFLFLTVFDYHTLFGLNVFFHNRYGDCKRNMIWCQMLVGIDKVVTKFFWPKS